MGLTYNDAGVDIERGDRFADFIRNFPSSAISKGIGGFAGGVEVDTNKYKKPVMLSCTDGVGTKLLVGEKLQKFDTLGIDLVAMCVNDLIVCGAQPQAFLDYIACGKINESVLKEVVTGVINGCEQSMCTLAGGETAEMPDVYDADQFDLAGFCVGLVEKSEILPKKDTIQANDVILGMPSTGLHSNGFSLARKVLPMDDRETLEQMLIPTKIYVRDMQPLLETGLIKGAAHITGGGLAGNISRVLPKGTVPELLWNWSVPELMERMMREHQVTAGEMHKVFNMGIGMALVTGPESADTLLSAAASHSVPLFEIGRVLLG